MGRYNFIPKLAAKRTSKSGENNFLMIILGDTGSGKSYSGMVTGLMTKMYATVNYRDEQNQVPRFDVGTIAFTADELMRTLDEGLPPQSIIQLDEGGEIADARKWWSDPNDAITSTIDTFRADRLSLIWCTPDLSRIDKRIREEADLVAQMEEKKKMKVQSVTKDRVTNTLLNPYPKLKQKVLKGSTQDGNYTNVHVRDLEELAEEVGWSDNLQKYEKQKKEFINEVQKKGREKVEGTDDEDAPQLDMMDISELIVNEMKDVDVEMTSKSSLKSIVRGRLLNEFSDHQFKKQDIKHAVNFVKSDPDYAEKAVS